MLVLHLSGLVMMAGTTVVDYSVFKTFWKQIDQGNSNPAGLMESTSNSSRLIGIGAALLVLTGIGMMAITHGVFGEQLWFRIKFGLVIILILNGILTGRRQGTKLRNAVANSGAILIAEAFVLRERLNRFFLLQLCLFLLIVFLSVFKFN
ncbi:putative membrane protein SirB2 [Mucilaginibacter sp. SG564]|nr:putative membrane protein SirB2 [Mucilaginibacter sp. SG564]